MLFEYSANVDLCAFIATSCTGCNSFALTSPFFTKFEKYLYTKSQGARVHYKGDYIMPHQSECCQLSVRIQLKDLYFTYPQRRRTYLPLEWAICPRASNPSTMVLGPINAQVFVCDKMYSYVTLFVGRDACDLNGQ